MHLVEHRAAAVDFSLTHEDGVACVRWLSPVIDDAFVDPQLSQLLEFVKSHQQVVLDLSCVQYIDYFGFESLLTCVRNAPGAIAVAGANHAIETTFILSRLQSSIPRFATFELAAKALKPTNDG